MKLRNSLIFILSFTVLAVSVHAAPVYKWVDEDGQVHYGSKPKNKNAKEIEIKKRKIDINTLRKNIKEVDEDDDSDDREESISTKERVLKQKKFIKALEAENKAIAEQKRKKQKQQELKITRCKASRDQLRRYENSGALYNLDEKGNRILLNKKQYDQAMSQARARVEKWCD